MHRTRKGGGVVIAAQEHLLVDELNLKSYSRLKVAEIYVWYKIWWSDVYSVLYAAGSSARVIRGDAII